MQIPLDESDPAAWAKASSTVKFRRLFSGWWLNRCTLIRIAEKLVT